MIITEEEQKRIIEKWNTKGKSTRDFLCYLEGMKAVWQLLEKKNKAETEQKEHYEKLHEHYDSKLCDLKNVVFEIKGTPLKSVGDLLNKPE